MGKEITINPVTRIEGHARVTLEVGDNGQIESAHLHVTQVRGFEKFCEGRPFHEMPSLMARVCGICPVSHLLASAKACDALMAVQIPPTAARLRQLLNLAQIAQSHALSFFYLSLPDLLLGMDANPSERHFFGVAAHSPALAKDGIQLRQTGQQIIEMLGGKRIHPAWVVPGGVSDPLTEAKRDRIIAMLPEALRIAQNALDWFKTILDRHQDEILTFANFPSLFMGLVSERGELEHYDGQLRIADAEGQPITADFSPNRYEAYIDEAVESDSYLKSPYYKPLGYHEGMYRVGPLARLNVCDRCGTPLADAELELFRRLDRRSSFHYHYARLIEIIYAIEKMELLLGTPDILSNHVRAYASPNSREGIGVSEAPRGTLIHHYHIDPNGLMTNARLIIATGHNNLAMSSGILQVARRFVQADKLTEGMLNRVEAVIRAFDPCLSCATHADGHMALHLQLVAPDGQVMDEIRR